MNLLFSIIFIIIIIRPTIISTYLPKTVYGYNMDLMNDIIYVVTSGVFVGILWYLGRCYSFITV